jgi:hypothetical protein
MSPEFESLRVVPSAFFYDVSHTYIFALNEPIFTAPGIVARKVAPIPTYKLDSFVVNVAGTNIVPPTGIHKPT